ncbi:hypothetical protein DBR34_05085 [Stenotrophomonas sp. HMWF003]|nr:hypothetical protein DBR34_05085 [Stenotrophomonas sp. HMWF003]
MSWPGRPARSTGSGRNVVAPGPSRSPRRSCGARPCRASPCPCPTPETGGRRGIGKSHRRW